MNLTYNRDLVTKLSDCHLILDANVFFHAVANDSFYDLLYTIQKSGCALLTIPSAVFEFARGAKDIEQFNWYVDFVNQLGVSTLKDVESEV